MDKDSLRREAKDRRLKRSADQVQRTSKKIAKNFYRTVDWSQVKSLHCYIPIIEMREPSTWPLLNLVWEKHPDIRVLTSRVRMEKIDLIQIDKATKFKEDPRGIPEPVGGKRYQRAAIDVIAIPLLAFDSKLNRLGYGSGFYDRFLVRRHKSIKVGYAFDDDKVKKVERLWHDVPLDMVVTDKKTYKP